MRASGLLMLVIGAAAAHAGDPPAAAGDSMAAAKKDFASIKSPSSQVEPGAGPAGVGGKGEGSNMDAAGADAGAAAQVPRLAVGEPSGKKEGTGNWLVDAMEQKTDLPRAPGGMDDLARGDLDLLKAAVTPDARRETEMKPSQASDRAASKALAASVYNPLDAFMGGWISAHDRELLLPARGDNLLGGPVLADLGQLGAPAGGAPGSRYGAPGDLRTTSNPYVSDLNLEPIAPMKPLSLPDIPGLGSLDRSEISRGVSTQGAAAGPLETPRTLVPDFAQPADDDKYFKQLKRF